MSGEASGPSADWREKGKLAQKWIERYDASGDEWLGWLMNYEVTTVVDENTKVPLQALTLVFHHQDGRTFMGDYVFQPYFLLIPEPGSEEEVELGLRSTFQESLASTERIELEDLELPNHLSGIKRTFIKLRFFNVQQLMTARNQLLPAVTKNKQKSESYTFFIDEIGRTKDHGAWTTRIVGLREYDVKYHVRVSIDCGVYVGKWYYVSGSNATINIRERKEYLTNAAPRICAFDIETTKAPLKFPKPDEDQVYMISWMLDGQGFLIINRDIVSADIEDFEYTPKPEYEGIFRVFNVENEEAVLRKFVELMNQQKPHVYVTYNGDFFDWPFMMRRMQEYKMSCFGELGFREVNTDGVLSPYVSHLDCMHWVNRDSYLPQGSRSLKAVSKAKLGYDPLEIDPEDMLPLAREDPQKMASYSVSDAVATYYLYMKYVHPFIFSLCTIIPMSPDEVLRKGSGTLCEQLLMVMAFEKNVVCPNKQVSEKERFYDGHLLDTETYIGGRVEALQCGIYRADVPIEWDVDPVKYQELIDTCADVYTFALEVELGIKVSEVDNFAEVVANTVKHLDALRLRPKRMECPHILHLDVGAMYPNIILTNRLQPPSMVTEESCAACCFNSPENDCKRPMKWIWRGEYYVLSRNEYNQLKAQIQTESVQTKKVEDIARQMAGRKDWKFAKKPLFESSKKKWKPGGPDNNKKDGYEGGGTGYRAGKNTSSVQAMLREEEERMLAGKKAAADNDDEKEDSGISKYSDLKDDEKHALLKKRVQDYCRKAYAKIHKTSHVDKLATVCQRENSFYVDTVRLFRDRRVAYKKELKKWKGHLDAVMEGEDKEHTVYECKGRLVLYESLQLAHKCILNSFYGYVMRKGSRWYSMEMAAAVTHCGATLITMSRDLVDKIGLSLELDTDGIWCCLPATFPMDVVFMKGGKKVKVSYPCALLNRETEVRYQNTQYQTLTGPGTYEKRTECSIFFEVDGPYKAMLLPAAKEEGKTIKKRYAVFEFDGKLAELKGFELKRRGELQLIKDFQAQLFAAGSMLLDGSSLEEVYNKAAEVADMCLDILFNKGAELDDDMLIDKIMEQCVMARRLVDYPKDQKSLAVTTARRLANFLGDDMTKDAGLKCNYIVAKKPDGAPVTHRAVPIQIFQAELSVRLYWMRKWLQDPMLGVDDGDIDIRDILDWDYYITRLSGNILKIIVIPAAFQKVKNPVPRVPYPDWLRRVWAERTNPYKQTTLANLLIRKPREPRALAAPKATTGAPLSDIEDFNNKSVPVAASSLASLLASASRKRQEPEVTRKAPPPPPSSFTKTHLSEKWGADTKQPVLVACTLWASSFLNSGDFPKWLAHSKHVWSTLGETDPANPKHSKKHDLKTMMGAGANALLNTMWEITEVREHATDPPNIVRVLAMVGDAVRNLRVHVPKYAIVNTSLEWAPDWIAAYHARPCSLTLPRKMPAMFLYFVPLGASSSNQEADFIYKLRCDPNVIGVFEAGVTASQRFQLEFGNACKVNQEKHKARGSKQNDEFYAEDLLAVPSNDSSRRSDARDSQIAGMFLFQSTSESRGVVALVMPHRGLVRMVFVRPLVKGVVDPTVNWTALFEEATQAAVNDSETLNSFMSQAPAEVESLLEAKIFGMVPSGLNYDVSFAQDTATAFRLINDELKQDLLVTRRILLMAQSQMTSKQLLVRIPDADQIPILLIPYNKADNTIYTTSMQWVKDLGRRALYRYLSARPFAAELYSTAKFASLPVGNLEGDASIKALDVLFARTLQKAYHALWFSPSSSPDIGTPGINDDDLVLRTSLEAASKPVVVCVPGSHHTWVVEMTLTHLEVMAVLAEDASQLSFTEPSITGHFHILRDLVWTLFNKSIQHNVSADNLLSDLCRWLKSPTSLLYEPKLAVFVWNLAKSLFGRLLTSLTKLGCKIVSADFGHIVVATPKTTLRDCATFTNYFLTALREQSIFKKVHIGVVGFWSEYLLLDRSNYAGNRTTSFEKNVNGTISMVSLAEDTGSLAFQWTVADRLPSSIKTKFILFLAEYLTALKTIRREVLEELQREEGEVLMTLQSTTEKLRKKTFARMQHRVENQWTSNLLKEVHNIQLAQKEQHGTRTAGADVAVEYAKVICHVLGNEAQLSEAVRHMKTTVLQMLGVAPHHKEAIFVPQDDLFTLENVACSFCHGISALHLLPGGLHTPDKARLDIVFKCEVCMQPFDTDVIESKLVDTANKLVAAYQIQDYTCTNCNQPQEHDMQLRCSCGSEWCPSEFTVARVSHQLYLLQGIAKLHNMPWLDSVATTLLSCC
ncbi:DNA polymerase epsilon catalytic subunit A [Diplonema papillatum]|nr:DNA polymerase epsilon catalytic subunit A [Diplonema papillatum]